jgi:hypothetical protein
MIELNWNNFKAKFNGKETAMFENLAYHLFCNEYNIKKGVFRFKNQVGIETEPIRMGNEIIGFQAKFYITKVSENKDDIIDSVKKAVEKNKELTKVLIYLNQEFSESTKKGKKDPDYKVDIEIEAKRTGVVIEWRVPSHFEIQLALPENNYLTEFFFSLGKNSIDFIDELKEHSENILYSIQSEIKFNNQTIKIDREPIIDSLKEECKKSIVAIVTGEGGSGKTAIIKELYNNLEGEIPFYIFKAAEFKVPNIRQFLGLYGNYSLKEFLEIHALETQKIFVVDSAEKLSDIENQDPFKELLSELFKNGWSLIFTTRYSYLDDLRFQFIEVYRLPFKQFVVNNLADDELSLLSTKYSFILPSDQKLLALIKKLFYLDEYLRNIHSVDKSMNLILFKNILWNTKIKKSSYTRNNIHILREDCLLGLVKSRCTSGLYYIKAEHYSKQALSKLEEDEIIKYDSSHGGYFITHDIYEEWSLEKIIEREYISSVNSIIFFEKIGTALPIRRAFRNWLSEKLIQDSQDIKMFIDTVFIDKKVETFWKDELLISVLLSEYAKAFFDQFENVILGEDQFLLIRIVFLLRIACKEADTSISELINFSEELPIDLNYLFTKPKGSGWNSTIDFIYKHIDIYNPLNIHFVIPLLQDWNNNNRTGEPTRKASLFALHFYKVTQLNHKLSYDNDIEKDLIKIILQGAEEIKIELSELIDEIIKKEWSKYSDPFFALCETILISIHLNITFLKALSEKVLQLADHFWWKSNKDNNNHDYDGIGVDKYYSLNSHWDHEYFPASAFQTPIYWLLKFSFKNTLKFILDFTNKTVQSYVDSGLDNSVETVEVIFDDLTIKKQFLSHCLWTMYRGVGSPITLHLLQSIHMALEKILLEFSKTYDEKILETWLIYLIKGSNSASITSVVASVVLAFPEKYFNVSKIIFRTIQFFQFDNSRFVSESHTLSIYSLGAGLNYKTKIFEDERIKTCSDDFRKTSLEHLILNYQLIRAKSMTDDTWYYRQREIYKIIDAFYEKMPKKTTESNQDKVIRLFLARIDKRKMKPEFEQKGDKIFINLNPEIDPELKKFSEDAQKSGIEMMKYSSLRFWSLYKFDKNNKYAEYEQYEKNPKLVIKETKEIIDGLKNENDGSFILFNQSTPGFACSALIKEYSKELTLDERQFCKDIIIEYATAPLGPNYEYQISDGVEAAISSIPFLFDLFPTERGDFKLILLFILFDNYPIGNYKRVCDYSIESIINNLWDLSFEDAHEIFLGYLKLAPLFKSVIETDKSLNTRNFEYKSSRSQILDVFKKKYKSEIKNFQLKKIQTSEDEFRESPLVIKETAFQLLPVKTTNEIHLNFVLAILPEFCKSIFDNSKEIDFSIRHRFFRKYAYFVLEREPKYIFQFIKPFVEHFSITEEMASFFQEMISAEDFLIKYEQFWLIWESFYDKIVDSCKHNRSNHYLKQILHNYLLAWPWWRKTAKNWHTLKEREKLFYEKVAKDMGHCPAVLYSISKFINEIGSGYINEGIFWISNIISENKNLTHETLETDTLFYLETMIRKYVYLNRTKIKTEIIIKLKVLIILNFLIEKGSVNGYLLREDII